MKRHIEPNPAARPARNHGKTKESGMVISVFRNAKLGVSLAAWAAVGLVGARLLSASVAVAEPPQPWRLGAVAQAEDGENGVNHLETLEIQAAEGELTIKIAGSTAPTYRPFTRLDPQQFVVDIGNSESSALSTSYVVESTLASKIEVSRLEALETTRIAIFLSTEAQSEVTTDGNTLVVKLSSAAAPVAEEAPAEEALPVEEAPVEEPVETAAVEPEPATPAKSVTALEADGSNGGVLVRIATDGRPGNYNSFTLDSPARVVVDVWNITSSLKSNQVAIGKGGVNRVRVGKHNDKVRFVFDLEKESEFQDMKSGSAILLAFGGAKLPADAPASAPVAAEPAASAPEASGNIEDPAPAEIAEEAPALEALEEAPAEEAPAEEAPAEEAPAEEAPAESAPLEAPVEAAVETAPAEAKPAPLGLPELEEPAALEVTPTGDEGAAMTIGATEPVRKSYKGQKRISMDFKDADIGNVLRIIAEVSNLNVIAGDEVSGTVTIKLKEVPWEEGLDVILATKGLGRENIGDIIRIAKKDTLEKEAADRLKLEEQKILAIPLVTRIIPVNYANAKELQPQIEPLLSSRGEVRVDERTNNIIVKDIPDNVVKAESMIRSLDLATPQVLIASKIVEARTNLNQALGVQWGGAGLLDAGHGTGTNVAFPNRVGIFGASTIEDNNGAVNYLVDLPAAAGAGSGGAIGFTFGHISNAVDLNLRLSALEATGDVELISSPRVTTLDNREAKIKQGFSLPFTTVSSRGTQTQFIDAVLELKVTPHVTANKSVIMRINVKKDAPSLEFVGARGEPSIAKKEAETEVLVNDGETTVIGGIYDAEKSEQSRGLPWFSKIPLLGWLFRTDSNTEVRRELLIFITPTVITQG